MSLLQPKKRQTFRTIREKWRIPPVTSTNLKVPRAVLSNLDDVRFLISWIGRSGHDVSESVLAQPGDTIGLEIRE